MAEGDRRAEGVHADHSHAPHGAHAGHAAHGDRASASGAARDPVCGMAVDPVTARHRARHADRDVFFCSARCRERFLADPERYAEAPHAVHAAHAPAAPVDGEPRATPGAGADVVYTCPMHPEIRRNGPGACPICGMALEPEVATADAGPSAELVDMRRRLWVALALAAPVVALEMGGHLLGL